MATSSSTTKTIVIKVEGGQAIASMNNVTLSTKELNTELLNLSKNAGKGKAASGATGGATATVLELGRTISDSNYGIRGMANNLSQLVSNFAFTTKAAGGFAAGLKSIWSAMMGPLGLVLAFQGVIALLERYSINSMKAKSATDDLGDSLQEQVRLFNVYKTFLDKSNTSLEDRNAIIKDLSILDKDLSKQLKKANGDREEENKIIEKFIKNLELETAIKVKKAELDKAELAYLEQKKVADEAEGVKRTEALGEQGNAYRERNRLLFELLDLVKQINQETDKETTTPSKKIFKQKYLDLSKIILGFQREEEVTLEKSEVKKAEIQKRYQEEDLLRRRENFEEKERLRLEEFKRSNASDEEKLLAEQKSEESIFKAKMDYFTALLALEDKYNADVKMRDEERYRGYEQRLRESQDELTNVMLEGQIAEANHLIAHLELQRKLVDEKESQDLIRLEKEKQLAMEQVNNLADQIYMTEEFQRKKTAIQRKYSNERTEIDKIEERQRLASVGAVGGLFSAMSGLAEKSSKEHKRLATAGALIDTYVGVNRALADPLLTTFGRFAAAATSLVQGLASVKAINSVSKSSASAGASSAGAVGGDRTFDFNLVGSTGTNQLAEAVGSQFQEPVQAYVVSSQMTSQQELDLQISTGASLGGD